MTAAQMSREFDLLWNNIMSNQAPGMTEYEKSVFLTKAQDEIVKNYLVPQSQGNTVQTGLGMSTKRDVDFSSLFRVTNPGLPAGGSSDKLHPGDNVMVFDLPQSMLAILGETVEVGDDKDAPESFRNLTVIPLSYQEYMRLTMKPYKYPLKDQCWRVMLGNSTVMLVPAYGWYITYTSEEPAHYGYKMQYIKLPIPIITATFSSDNLCIVRGGIKYGYVQNDEYHHTTTGTDASVNPEVPESIHEDIVQRAVELAKAAWSSSDNFVAMGRRTE